MAKQRDLSAVDDQQIPHGDGFRIGIVSANWNKEITGALFEGARNTLLEYGVRPDDIYTCSVPGSFELPQGAALMIESRMVDAIICLGCVIQGETRHFEFIAQAVAQGCMKLSLDTLTPVIFGVLTTDNYEQARERSGGKHGNKGDEAAMAALQMAALHKETYPDEYGPEGMI